MIGLAFDQHGRVHYTAGVRDYNGERGQIPFVSRMGLHTAHEWWVWHILVDTLTQTWSDHPFVS